MYTKTVVITVGGISSSLKADFNANLLTGKSPLTVHFSDQSTGSPTSWYWDFGDGWLSQEQNPTHTYEDTGSFNVKLIVGDWRGYSEPEIKEEYITVTSDDPYIESINVPNSNSQFLGYSYPIQVTIHNPTKNNIPITVKCKESFDNSYITDYGDISYSYPDSGPLHDEKTITIPSEKSETYYFYFQHTYRWLKPIEDYANLNFPIPGTPLTGEIGGFRAAGAFLTILEKCNIPISQAGSVASAVEVANGARLLHKEHIYTYTISSTYPVTGLDPPKLKQFLSMFLCINVWH